MIQQKNENQSKPAISFLNGALTINIFTTPSLN